MARVMFDPENDRRAPLTFPRHDMRSAELRRRHDNVEEQKARKLREKLRQQEVHERQARIEMLAEEAARARVEILARKAAAKEAAEAAGLVVLPVDFAIHAITQFDRILRRAMKTFRVSRLQLLGPSRGRDISFARQFVMYWAARLTVMSTTHIGLRLGRKDHTPVVHGHRAYVEKRAAMKRNLRPAR